MKTPLPLARLARAVSIGRPRPQRSAGLGIGTVRHIDDEAPGWATVDVETLEGEHFVARLQPPHPLADELRAGLVVAVRFDPDRPDNISLADDLIAARGAFDRMLVRKGLTTAAQLDVIRRGNRSHGLVTALRTTGETCEDHVEVEVDLMVTRTEGGQFPAHETAFIPASSVSDIGPGSVVDVYYRADDESAVALCVPKR